MGLLLLRCKDDFELLLNHLSTSPKLIPDLIFDVVKTACTDGGSLIIDMEVSIEIGKSVAAIFAKKMLAANNQKCAPTDFSFYL